MNIQHISRLLILTLDNIDNHDLLKKNNSNNIIHSFLKKSFPTDSCQSESIQSKVLVINNTITSLLRFDTKYYTADVEMVESNFSILEKKNSSFMKENNIQAVIIIVDKNIILNKLFLLINQLHIFNDIYTKLCFVHGNVDVNLVEARTKLLDFNFELVLSDDFHRLKEALECTIWSNLELKKKPNLEKKSPSLLESSKKSEFTKLTNSIVDMVDLTKKSTCLSDPTISENDSINDSPNSNIPVKSDPVSFEINEQKYIDFDSLFNEMKSIKESQNSLSVAEKCKAVEETMVKFKKLLEIKDDDL